MDFIRLPETDQVSFWDRCVYAYYAFRLKTKPDVAYILEQITKMQEADIQKVQAADEKYEAAVAALEGYEKATLDSITHATANWRELFDSVMLYVEQLPVENQIIVMQHIFSRNRYVVTEARFRQWMARNAEAILDNLKE